MEFEMYKEKKVIFKTYIDESDGSFNVDAVDEDGFLLSHFLYITKNGKIEEGDDE